MRAIAIIPARYDSSRFKGKPLADLCGRPMLWWVYHQGKNKKSINRWGLPRTTTASGKCAFSTRSPAK